MRIVRLHEQGTPVLGRGTSGISPKKSLVNLIAQVSAASGAPVNATASIMAEVSGFNAEPITFSGASIISFSGTTNAQWEGQVENNGYTDIFFDLLSVSGISFQAAATEEE